MIVLSFSLTCLALVNPAVYTGSVYCVVYWRLLKCFSKQIILLLDGESSLVVALFLNFRLFIDNNNNTLQLQIQCFILKLLILI